MSNRLGLKLSAAPTEASAATGKGAAAAEAACVVVIVVIIPWNRHHRRMRICKGILIRPQMTAVFLQIRSAVRKGMHIFTSLTHAITAEKAAASRIIIAMPPPLETGLSEKNASDFGLPSAP